MPADHGWRNPYVGSGADGARRSADIDRDELDTLDTDDPRREALEESVRRWERQAEEEDQMSNLEAIRLEPEENGWELVVETTAGVHRFNAHGMASSGELDDQIRAMGSDLITWKMEGRRAAREHEIDLAKRETDEAHDRMVGDA